MTHPDVHNKPGSRRFWKSLFIFCMAVMACRAGSPALEQSYTVNENRISLTGKGFSFELPPATWDTKLQSHQSQNGMELFSFTRKEPVLFDDGQAYFPTISVIIEDLAEILTPKEYDEYVRTSI